MLYKLSMITIMTNIKNKPTEPIHGTSLPMNCHSISINELSPYIYPWWIGVHTPCWLQICDSKHQKGPVRSEVQKSNLLPFPMWLFFQLRFGANC